jgi:hypothetical protein
MQCFHCGREVGETTHKQRSYTVDYYLLHTGKSEWALFRSPKENVPPLRYLKLTHPLDVFTCVHCYELPEIKKKLDDDFKGIASFVEVSQEPEKNSSTPEAH